MSVVQRFHTDTRVERDGVPYQFVRDRDVPWLSTTSAPREFVEAIASHDPQVVHINGLIFPALISAIRETLGRDVAIVAQHHGGEFPIRGSGLLGAWQRRNWRRGLAAANALSFTAESQAAAWRDAGVVSKDQRILEIVEAGTSLAPAPRDRARLLVGATGDPLILWVGRLTTNKDPLTVIDGFERALPAMASARMLMIFSEETLLPEVETRVRRSPQLVDRITLIGRIDHAEMPAYLGAADLYVSGSHAEGSGYALIEAMASGLIPVVSDIPSFRVITGDAGTRWEPGDAASLSRALADTWLGDRERQRRLVRDQFARMLAWDAIASRTVESYRSVLEGIGTRRR